MACCSYRKSFFDWGDCFDGEGLYPLERGGFIAFAVKCAFAKDGLERAIAKVGWEG